MDGVLDAAQGHCRPGGIAILLTLAHNINIGADLGYRRYSRVLKWLTVSVLAYAVTAFLVHAPRSTVLRATFVPHISFDSTFLYVITAVIGTTISPYMFFWQTSQEVEESRGRGGRRPLADVRTDNAIGMSASQLTAWFVIGVTGDVLHAAGVTTVRSAADAAKALVSLATVFGLFSMFYGISAIVTSFQVRHLEQTFGDIVGPIVHGL